MGSCWHWLAQTHIPGGPKPASKTVSFRRHKSRTHRATQAETKIWQEAVHFPSPLIFSFLLLWYYYSCYYIFLSYFFISLIYVLFYFIFLFFIFSFVLILSSFYLFIFLFFCLLKTFSFSYSLLFFFLSLLFFQNLFLPIFSTSILLKFLLVLLYFSYFLFCLLFFISFLIHNSHFFGDVFVVLVGIFCMFLFVSYFLCFALSAPVQQLAWHGWGWASQLTSLREDPTHEWNNKWRASYNRRTHKTHKRVTPRASSSGFQWYSPSGSHRHFLQSPLHEDWKS